MARKESVVQAELRELKALIKEFAKQGAYSVTGAQILCTELTRVISLGTSLSDNFWLWDTLCSIDLPPHLVKYRTLADALQLMCFANWKGPSFTDPDPDLITEHK